MAERCIRTTERERLSSTACARRLYTATPPLLCYVVERENPKAYTPDAPTVQHVSQDRRPSCAIYQNIRQFYELSNFGYFWLLLAGPWRLLAAPGCDPGSWLLLVAPGGSWLSLAVPGSSWRLLASCAPARGQRPAPRQRRTHTQSANPAS